MRYSLPTATFALAAACCFGAPVAAGDQVAPFLGQSIYATAAGCIKHRTVTAGGPRTADTVAETLSARGYERFDGVCRFDNIVERYADRLWTVSMSCVDGTAERVLRTEVWRRQPDGSLTVTNGETARSLIACRTARPVVPGQK